MKRRRKKAPAPQCGTVETVRIPLNSGITLEVPSLTVILGAALVTGPEVDPADVDGVPLHVEVDVDDEPFLNTGVGGLALDVDAAAGVYWRDRDTDPVIITPREGGVVVGAGIVTPAGKHVVKLPKSLRGAEVWVRIAR